LSGDVVIMLGAGTYPGVADLSGEGFLNGEALERLLTAVRIQRRLQVPLLVSSGQVFPDMVSGAALARRILMDLGIAEEQILIEEKSRDTLENAVFSKAICDRLGFSRPLLVTSALHMKRAMLAFDRAGVAVTPVPAGFRVPVRPDYAWHDYLPQASALNAVAAALHEYLGLWFYRLAG
jgi:uncharacterized SAM-binding protein YcdF (DUF218 family)